MTARHPISIELDGGPWDGKRIDNYTPGKALPRGTWDDGWHYVYQPAGYRTAAGREIYTLTWAAPHCDHPSMQGGEL